MLAPTSSRTQALERIDRFFEDYESQVNNRLAGIGKPAKERR